MQIRAPKAKSRLSRSVLIAIASAQPFADVLDLARCTGHMDLKMLISTYYRESAAEIAKKLG